MSSEAERLQNLAASGSNREALSSRCTFRNILVDKITAMFICKIPH